MDWKSRRLRQVHRLVVGLLHHLSVADASGAENKRKRKWKYKRKRKQWHPIPYCIICPSLTLPGRKENISKLTHPGRK